jgi:hypothetical protein
MDLEYWNRTIYKDENGKFIEGGIKAKELWNEFSIESYPLFKGACYSHIPEKWAEDVRIMLRQIKLELGDRVQFQQIKEKFCELVVYYKAEDDKVYERVKSIISECINRLRDKGIYPPLHKLDKGV